MSLLALQDLFRRYRDRATGVWKLGQEPSRTIYFDYGDTVFAQSTHLQDRLTTILVERGRITQAQMDYALANLKPGISIGKNLIEMGFITQRDLLDVAKLQVERIIDGAMAQPDALPVFELRELDANVVRLPLSTAQILLSGILALQDRESLLELLGPLNQVVVLQGRSLQDLTLPADLARIAPLLDGTHTLLELGRESNAEPLRVGAFALFLREMGWARLHEMPPLDRQALDLALTQDLETPSAPLPEPPPEGAPNLFATIQEAARPTTNLEHLSQALDQEPFPGPASEPAPEPLYLPENLQVPGFPEPEPGLHAERGQAQVPTPSVELPALPEAVLEPAPEPAEEPPVTLRISMEPAVPDLPPPPEPEPEAAGAPVGRWVLLVLFLAACVAGGAYMMKRRARAPHPPTKPAAVAAPKQASAPPKDNGPSIAVPPAAPKPPEAQPEPAKAEPPKAEPAKAPAPKAEPPAKAAPPPAPKGKEPRKAPEPKAVDASLGERLESLRKGDLDRALAQGLQHVKAAPHSHWALRLEIACQGETIRRVADIFKGEKPDLFLLPMKMRDGRGCYQVLYGDFPSRDAAEKASKHLPATFMADRNRPKPFQFSEIPKEQ